MSGGNINNLRIAYNLRGGECDSIKRTYDQYWNGYDKNGNPPEKIKRTYFQYWTNANKDGDIVRTWEGFFSGQDTEGNGRTWAQWWALPSENGDRTWADYIYQTRQQFIVPLQNISDSALRGTLIQDTAILASQVASSASKFALSIREHSGMVLYTIGNAIYSIPYSIMNTMYSAMIMITTNIELITSKLSNFLIENKNMGNTEFINAVWKNIKISARATGSAVASAALSTVNAITTNITDAATFIATGIKYIIEGVYKLLTEDNLITTVWVSCCSAFGALSGLTKIIEQATFDTINSTLRTLKESLYKIYDLLSNAGSITTIIALISVAAGPAGVAVSAITATISTILHLASHVVYSIYGMVVVAWTCTITDCATYQRNMKHLQDRVNESFDSWNCGFANVTGPWSFMGWIWAQFELPTNIGLQIKLCIVKKFQLTVGGCNEKDSREMKEELDKLKLKPLTETVTYPDYVHVPTRTLTRTKKVKKADEKADEDDYGEIIEDGEWG